MIRTYTGIGERSAWRLAWLPVLFMFAYGLVPLGFRWDGSFPQWLMTIYDWLPFAFLLVFVGVCWRARRFLWTPVATALGVTAFVMLVHAALVSPLGFGETSRQARREQVEGFNRYIAERKQQEEAVKT